MAEDFQKDSESVTGSEAEEDPREEKKVVLTEELILQKWNEFKAKYKKQYENKKEERFRKAIFISKLKHIEEHNEKFAKGLVTFRLGINQYSDYTEEEKKKLIQ